MKAGDVRPEITTLGKDNSVHEGVLLVVVDAVGAAGAVFVAMYGWRSCIFDDETSITAVTEEQAPRLTPANTTRKQSRTMRLS